MSMQSIGDTTKKVIKKWQGAVAEKGTDVIKGCLARSLSTRELKHITSYYFKNSRVILGIDSSVWLYMFNVKKRQLSRWLTQALKPREGDIEVFLILDVPKKDG